MNMKDEQKQNLVAVLSDIYNLDAVKVVSSDSDLCQFYKDCEKNNKLKGIVFLDKIRQREKCLNFFLKSKARYKGLILTSQTKETIEEQITKMRRRKTQYKLKSFIGVITASSLHNEPQKLHSEIIDGNIRQHMPSFTDKMDTTLFRKYYEMEYMKRERIIGILNAITSKFLPITMTKRNLKSARRDTRKRNFRIGCYRVPYAGELGVNTDDVEWLMDFINLEKKKEYFYIQENEVQKVAAVMKDVKIVKGFVDVKKHENALTPTFSACLHIYNYYAGTNYSCWEEFNTKRRKENQKIVIPTEKSCLMEILKSLKDRKLNELPFDEFDTRTLERFIVYVEDALENDHETQTLIEEQGKNEYNSRFDLYNNLKDNKLKEQRNKYKRNKEANTEHKRERKKRKEFEIESLDIKYLHQSKTVDSEIYDLLNGKRNGTHKLWRGWI